MKTAMIWATMTVLCATLASAQTPAAASPGYTGTLRNSWNSVKRYVASSAEKMPDASYGFKPTPEVRSFGELIGHLANEHYLLCSPLKGEKNPKADVDFEKKTTKTELVQAINESNRVLRCGVHGGQGRTQNRHAVLGNAKGHTLSRDAAQRHTRQRALRQHDHLSADEGDRSTLVDANAVGQGTAFRPSPKSSRRPVPRSDRGPTRRHAINRRSASARPVQTRTVPPPQASPATSCPGKPAQFAGVAEPDPAAPLLAPADRAVRLPFRRPLRPQHLPSAAIAQRRSTTVASTIVKVTGCAAAHRQTRGDRCARSAPARWRAPRWRRGSVAAARAGRRRAPCAACPPPPAIGGGLPASWNSSALAHGYDITTPVAVSTIRIGAHHRPITLCQLKSRARLLRAGSEPDHAAELAHDQFRGHHR